MYILNNIYNYQKLWRKVKRRVKIKIQHLKI